MNLRKNSRILSVNLRKVRYDEQFLLSTPRMIRGISVATTIWKSLLRLKHASTSCMLLLRVYTNLNHVSCNWGLIWSNEQNRGDNLKCITIPHIKFAGISQAILKYIVFGISDLEVQKQKRNNC